jgi:hypothetical protein
MRTLAVFAVVVLAGCSESAGGGAGGPGDASTSQCSAVVQMICDKAVACSTGHPSPQTVFIIGANDAGGPHNGLAANGDETHCLNLLNLACKGSDAGTFTAVCGAEVSALTCGTDPMYGNGVEISTACWDSL